MANPGFDGPDDPRFDGIAQAMRDAGGIVAHAAKALGLDHSTFRRRWQALQAYNEAPEGIKAALEVSGLDMTNAHSGWRIIQHKDGSRDSVYWVKPKEDGPQPDDIADRIADRLNRVQPAPAIKRPPAARSDLRNFIPLFDVHLSMRVGTYGTAQAVERLRTGTADIVERSPSAECTIILNGGDFTENNDPSNQTPQSKHPLAVDAEYDDTTDIAVDVTAELIETALRRSDHVIYKALRGNHDPATARILRAALKQRYRKNDRVTIETDGMDFFAHEWRGNLICGFHGDIKRNIKDIVLGFADRYCEEWGRTRGSRDLWHGHLHNELVQDIGGMRSNRVRAICPGGRHALENLFSTPSEMLGVTYKAGGGRFGGVIHGFDPLEAFA